MSIPNPQAARHSSLQEFVGFFKKSDNHPSFTNLFSVHFATPQMLNLQTNGRFNTETGDMSLLLDYYAKTVNLPSKQVTTGQVTNVGSGYKFATGSSFSQISMTFQVPRSQMTRNLFERWMSLMANDANQYTDYYSNYVAPKVVIYKWERGGGDYVYSDPKMLRALREAGNNFLLSKKNKLTAAWVLHNVFPYNIGSIQLDNEQAKTMDLNIQFYYERYRFYTEDQFDDTGVAGAITVPSGLSGAPAGTTPTSGTDDVTTPETPRNTTARNPRALLDARQRIGPGN
ncbi:hypothetical protein [Synechococcus phage S-H25]|nr:hypothetical protein [Synechococcus phage S-H25]